MAVLADEDASVADTFYPVPEMAMELEPEPVPEDVVPSAAVDQVEDAEMPVPGVAAVASPDETVEPDDALDDGGLREALERTASAMAAEAVVAQTQAEAPEEAKPPRKARLGHKWPWDVDADTSRRRGDCCRGRGRGLGRRAVRCGRTRQEMVVDAARCDGAGRGCRRRRACRLGT